MPNRVVSRLLDCTGLLNDYASSMSNGHEALHSRCSMGRRIARPPGISAGEIGANVQILSDSHLCRKSSQPAEHPESPSIVRGCGNYRGRGCERGR